jgi:hypothetical protein
MNAGGVPSPPTDPVAASGKPLKGQEETNSSLPQQTEAPAAASSSSDEDQVLWRVAAIDLGRRSYTRHISHSLQFEQAEAELAREWNSSHHARDQRVAWETAREVARDAWEQARTALQSGDAKPSAR